MLDIKPVTSYNLPNQVEMGSVTKPYLHNAVTELPNANPATCHHPFVDSLLTGVTNLILNAVSNILSQIGLGNQNNNISQNPASSTIARENTIEKPSWIQQGIDFIGNLFGGKLGGIFSVLQGEGSFFSKAKDILGKIF